MRYHAVDPNDLIYAVREPQRLRCLGQGAVSQQSLSPSRAPCAAAAKTLTTMSSLHWQMLARGQVVRVPRSTALHTTRGHTSSDCLWRKVLQSKENRHVNYHLGLRQECERRLGLAGPV